jgi:hypothetical protein
MERMETLNILKAVGNARFGCLKWVDHRERRRKFGARGLSNAPLLWLLQLSRTSRAGLGFYGTFKIVILN